MMANSLPKPPAYDRDLQAALGRVLDRTLSPTVAAPLDGRMQDLLRRLDKARHRIQ